MEIEAVQCLDSYLYLFFFVMFLYDTHGQGEIIDFGSHTPTSSWDFFFFVDIFFCGVWLILSIVCIHTRLTYYLVSGW